jgi:hypothetical protein
MKKTFTVLFALLVFAGGTAHAIPTLYESHTWSQGGYDSIDVNFSAFNMGTGLGTVSMAFSGAGSHYGGLYVDHELNEPANTFFNEYGGVAGSAPAGLSWQIDEPGFGTAYTGTIYNNFSNNSLSGLIFNGLFNGPEDVAMAMIRSFDLSLGQTALLTFTISDTATDPNIFCLAQYDGDPGLGPETIFFSSNLDISGGAAPVPEPSTVLLLGAGLLGLGFYARQRRNA